MFNKDAIIAARAAALAAKAQAEADAAAAKAARIAATLAANPQWFLNLDAQIKAAAVAGLDHVTLDNPSDALKEAAMNRYASISARIDNDNKMFYSFAGVRPA